MGFVHVLRLGPQAGILICDEESWHLRMRRNFFSDPVTWLVDEEAVRQYGLDAVYAGVGTPGFQAELGRRTAVVLRERSAAGQPVTRLREVGRVLVGEMNRLTREWRDRQLRLRFGFSTADFRRGWYENAAGERIEIASEKVKNSVAKLLESDRLAGQHKHNHGVLMGWDDSGWNAFTVKGELGVLSQLSAGWDALGTGCYNAFTVMSRHLNQVTLKNRRAGADRYVSILQALRAAIDSMDYVNESGGCLQLIILDAARADRVHVSHHRAKLLEETVRMLDAGQLTPDDARELIEALLFGEMSTELLQERWQKSLADPLRAGLLLRGWKFDAELDELLAATKKTARPAGRGKRGKGKSA